MKNALCLGSFDGLHKGHAAVLNVPCDCKKIAVTFKVPPKAVIKNQPLLIMSEKDKCAVLKEFGVKETVLLDFSKVKDTQPEDFFEWLVKEYNPSLISCVYDYRFGKNGAGDTDLLLKLCEVKGIELRKVPAVKENGKVISSSSIREMLATGKLSLANKLLYTPFSFEAEVVKGDKRGRTIGFPTINQKYPDELVRLKFGVYKTKVLWEDKAYYGITNIGIRPTFQSEHIISETFIKDFSGDLYGKNVRIIPLKFIREEIKFSGIDELKAQIYKDLKI